MQKKNVRPKNNTNEKYKTTNAKEELNTTKKRQKHNKKIKKM